MKYIISIKTIFGEFYMVDRNGDWRDSLCDLCVFDDYDDAIAIANDKKLIDPKEVIEGLEIERIDEEL